MKRWFIVALLLSTVAQAGLPPTTSKVAGDSSNITTFNYQFPTYSGTHTGITVSIGARTPTIRTVTATGNINASDNANIILVNASAAITLTLPTHVAGQVFILKDISGSAETNNITIARNVGTEQIDAATLDYLFQTNYGSITVLDDGTNYWLI